jgi:hypothetical protein
MPPTTAEAERPAPAKIKLANAAVRIPASIWLQVRFHAVMTGTSAARVTAAALTQYLERVGHQTSADMHS